MKTLVTCLVLALGAGVGCVTLPALHDKPKPDATPAPTPPARPRSVTAEQVTDDNAHEKADALLQELDREAERPTPAPAEKSSSAKKK